MEDPTLWPDEAHQVGGGAAVRDLVQEGRHGRQEGLHVEGRVEDHRVGHQTAGKTPRVTRKAHAGRGSAHPLAAAYHDTIWL